MLSVRVNRDRRGYDHIYLVEETRRRGRAEGRLLYWSRMPGGVRVVRDPFDDETKAALERANPGIAFDWPQLLKTMHASAAAARWNARQQQGGPPGGGPPSGPRRSSGRSPQRRWREDDEDEPGDVEGAAPRPQERGSATDARPAASPRQGSPGTAESPGE